MILQVKEFNKQALVRWQNAVDSYEFGKGGFPFIPMYIFQKDDGKERKNGYVVIKEHSYRFFLNKEKAILNNK